MGLPTRAVGRTQEKLLNDSPPARDLQTFLVFFQCAAWVYYTGKSIENATKLIEDAVNQRGKKVVSDSPGLVDFEIGLVNAVLNLPDRQAKIFRRIKITKVL